MSEAVVATGVTEVLEVLATDVYGAALTGLTDVAVYVRRSSDGYLLDWNDNTFKAAAWTTRQRVLTETDAVNQAGWYRYSWDMSTIVSPASNDVYTVTFAQTTLTNAANLPASGVIRTGRFVDTIASNLTTATSTLATSAALATAQGNITTILGYGAPPSAATISTQVNADIATAHGAGSYQTASVAGLALEATLTAMKGATFDGATDSLEALRNRGDAAWITGSGWAVPGDAMTLTAGERTAIQAKILDDATPFHGASIASILAFGAPPSAATIATQVDTTLSGAHGAGSWLTADISTLATAAALAAVATDATKSRRALWNRRALTSLGVFTLYADDAVTPLATATVTDKDGAAITLATGNAARTTALT